MELNTLRCSGCRRNKPDEDFPHKTKSPPARRGRDHKCRECKASYYAANRERMAAQCREANIKRRYGLSAEEYDARIAEGCEVCGSKDRVVMDHCHTEGTARGPLCTRCNVVLGRVSDDPGLLRDLSHYLERYRA